MKNTGISYNNVKKIIAIAGLSRQAKINTLNIQSIHLQVLNIQKQAYQQIIESQREAKNKQKELKTYKGIRYSKNLPARGQRTHTNAQTAKKTRTGS
jgi:small subunit ribosomal protein S13